MGKKNKRSLKAELKRIRKNVEIANSSIDKISKKTKKKNQKILKQMHDIIEEASAESFGIERAMRRMAGEDEEDIDQALSSSKKKKKKKGFTAISLTVFSRKAAPKPSVDVDADTIDLEDYTLKGTTSDGMIAKEPENPNVSIGVPTDGVTADNPTNPRISTGDPCPAPKKATRKTKKETKE